MCMAPEAASVGLAPVSVVAAAAAADNATAPPPLPTLAANLDWVPREQLADTATLAPYCSGAYIEPALPAGTDNDTRITIDAGNVLYEPGTRARLDGDVVLRQGFREIRAPHVLAELQGPTSRALFGDGVSVREEGLLLVGARGDVDLNTRAANLDDVSFVLHAGRMRGSAERVERGADASLYVREADITRCEPDDNAWTLATRRVDIDERQEFATARSAVLRLGRVPIFYSPWLRFPIGETRQSGFLFPSYGYTVEDGTDFALPYYLNLAPNYDLTIEPRYRTRRGVGIEIEGRHLLSFMSNEVGAGFMPQDAEYDGKRTREEFRDLGAPGGFSPAARWVVNWQQHGRFGPLLSRIDYTAVSDLDYFNDLGTNLAVTSRSELRRAAELGWRAGGLHARLAVKRLDPLQIATAEPYRRLPELAAGYRHTLNGLPVTLSLAGEWVRFQRDDALLTGFDRTIGERWHVEPRLQANVDRPYGHVHVSAAYALTGYELRRQPVGFDASPRRQVPLFSVDAGSVFERAFGDPGQGYLQTLEPRIFYLWSGSEDQSRLPLFDVNPLTFNFAQLYREQLFSGRDRIGDDHRVTLGLTTRILGQQDGGERLRFAAGRIVRLRDSALPAASGSGSVASGGSSPWATELDLRLARGFGLRGDLVYDVAGERTQEGRVELRYAPVARWQGDQRVAYAAFDRSGSDVEQADAALYWPLSQHWRAIGRWQYDIERRRTLESFGGFEYDACCFRVRLLARRALKNALGPSGVEAERAVLLQVVLKGLAGIGGDIGGLLESGIPGYREEVNSGD